MKYLSKSLYFPPLEETTEEGLLAIGGDLSIDRLLLAYRSGIFPWFEDNQPILWWSPDLRMVLFPENFHVSKSLQKTITSQKFKITFNTCFPEVVKNCVLSNRKDQSGTWITTEMEKAYCNLHLEGHAISVEAWKDDKLVGGLYGVDLKKENVFCGESMFSKTSDASKVAFYFLVKYLQEKNYKLIDCQMYTEHLESLGAMEIPRETFLEYLTC